MRVVAFAGNLGSGKDTAADRFVADHNFVRVSLADPLKRLGHSVFGFSEQQLWGPSDARNAIDKRYGPDSDEWEYAYDRLRVEGQYWLEDEVFPSGADFNQILDAHASLLSWFDGLFETNRDTGLSPRVMLQSLGTEYGRQALYSDVWLDVAMRTSAALLSGKSDEPGLHAASYNRVQGLLYHTEPGDVGGVVIPDVRFENELAGIKARGGKIVRIYRPATDDRGASTGIAGHASETSLSTIPDSEYDFILQNAGTLQDFYDAIDIAAQVVLTSRS